MVEHVVNLHIPEWLPGDTEGEGRQGLRERIEKDRERFCFQVGRGMRGV